MGLRSLKSGSCLFSGISRFGSWGRRNEGRPREHLSLTDKEPKKRTLSGPAICGKTRAFLPLRFCEDFFSRVPVSRGDCQIAALYAFWNVFKKCYETAYFVREIENPTRVPINFELHSVHQITPFLLPHGRGGQSHQPVVVASGLNLRFDKK